MKPAAFEYLAPRSLEEAVAALAQHGEEAKLIAGGQSLVPLLALRLAAPAVLVDLNGVDELAYHRAEGETLVLGALTRHRDVETLDGLPARCALVAEGVSHIGHVAIRNRGTVGGSVAHADPAGEWPSIVVALDGEIEAVGPGGSRTLPAASFFDTYFTTALEPTEIVREVRLRLPTGRVGSTYLELARRRGDFAIAGVAALLVLDQTGTVADARLAMIGVRDAAVRATDAEAVLRGQKPSDELFAEAGEAIDGQIDPSSDLHGTAEFRRHIAKVLVRRALATAHDRASGEG